jgi:hypothetical protein
LSTFADSESKFVGSKPWAASGSGVPVAFAVLVGDGPVPVEVSAPQAPSVTTPTRVATASTLARLRSLTIANTAEE